MDQLSSLLNSDLLTNLSTLLWTSGNSELAEKLALLRISSVVWKTVTREQETEMLRNAAILQVAMFMKKNPEASKEELLEEIEMQITEFAHQIEKM